MFQLYRSKHVLANAYHSSKISKIRERSEPLEVILEGEVINVWPKFYTFSVNARFGSLAFLYHVDNFFLAILLTCY